MIEDLHTAYWPPFGGGLHRKENFFGFVRDLIDDMHHWYHDGPVREPAFDGSVSAIHVHDFDRGVREVQGLPAGEFRGRMRREWPMDTVRDRGSGDVGLTVERAWRGMSDLETSK